MPIDVRRAPAPQKRVPGRFPVKQGQHGPIKKARTLAERPGLFVN